MTYRAPVEDMIFTLNCIADLQELGKLQAFENYEDDLVAPILEEASKLATEILGPLNQVGDTHGATLCSDGVKAAPGFSDAFDAFREGGWTGLAVPEKYDGQGLPKALGLAVMETVHSANMSFGLAPMLSSGAIEALIAHGSVALKERFLPKLVSGEWTGTMNLTEPHAGSDLSGLKTKAMPNGDGSFAVTGQKIYITWGDHDCASNIIHLVLAKLPDAPEGSRGISLFLVPKFHVDHDGAASTELNGVRCIGLEKKLGIHASPTCVMEYDRAQAWLIGEPNRGLACMFTMMNSARLNVGLEGVAVGEAAYQAAYDYAKERKQGSVQGINGPAPILHHADVRRTLTTMRARVSAGRAICYACAVAADLAEYAADTTTRTNAKLREDLLTPIAKAWSTDMGVDVASLGVQVHGGMGFMDETLAAQLYRDARIGPIYEGTNGIQAIDLVGRKLFDNQGAAMDAMLEEIEQTISSACEMSDAQLLQIAQRLESGRKALKEASAWMIETMSRTPELAHAGASTYLKLAGDVIGGHYLTKGAVKAHDQSSLLHSRWIALAGFYAETILASASGQVPSITRSGQTFMQESEALFGMGL